MAMAIIPFNSEVPITVTGGVANNNQLSLPGGKVVVELVASTDVVVGFWGPFPAGAVVDPTTKPMPGKLAVKGSSVTVGSDALNGAGNYLVVITSPTTSTVQLKVRSWSPWDNILQFIWKFTSPNKA